MVFRLKPKWDYVQCKGDKNGYLRGARGIDGAFDADGKDFIKTADPKADAFMYGPTIRSPRTDGAQAVQTNSRDPGTLTNQSRLPKGYAGVDE